MTTKVKHSYEAPTAKQMAYAESLARKAGYRYLSHAQKACFGRSKVGGLKRADASYLIDWLRSQS